jgi:hypothetical protein
MPKAAAGAQSYLHFATCKQHGCVETGETGRTYFKRSISITWFHRDRATILTSAHITFKTQLREHRKVSDIKEHYLHGQSARTMSLKAPALMHEVILWLLYRHALIDGDMHQHLSIDQLARARL